MIPEFEAIYRPVIDAVIMVIAIVVMTRVVGLRSFSKMSGFDFAITVAFGSIIAATVLSPDRSFITGIIALAALFSVQMVASNLRVNVDKVENAIDNCPLLLMEGEQIFDENLKKAKITHSDLRAKLREANVLNTKQVRAVILETTGDISVLHGQSEDFSDDMLEGVQRN